MMSRSFTVPLSLLAMLAPSGPLPDVQAQEIELERLETMIETGRKAWGIPGLAVAIVKDDAVVLVQGYGVREAGGSDSVDPHTLFAIGSTTKAFTAVAVAMLVDEGRLGWDDSVVTRLPGFSLRDPYTTGEITIRDLLAHRSGLPMANLMWLGGKHDRSELVRRIRHLEPDSSFRSALSYQNVLYTVAGLIVEAVSGSTWDAFLAERVFRPLGMEHTNTSVDSLAGLDNVARPHVMLDGKPRSVPYRNIDHIGPAGSINSSAIDMAAWLRLQLAGGKVDGGQLLSEQTLAETHGPQIVMRREFILAEQYPKAHALAYGFGWVVSDYHGRTLLDHAGGIDGMTSLVALVPEEKLGVAILANSQLPVPPYWILYSLLDSYLEVDPTDWHAYFQALADRVEAPPTADRVAGTRPSVDLAAYAGDYRHTALGEARVARRDDNLYVEYGNFAGALEHWHFDTFRVRWRNRAWLASAGPGWITFRLGRDGTVERLELEVSPGETWDLERVPERRE